MKTKRNVCIFALLNGAALVVGCGDDTPDWSPNGAGSAGESGGGSSSSGGTGGKASGGSSETAGSSNAGKGGSAGSGGTAGSGGVEMGGANAGGEAGDSGEGGDGGGEPMVDCSQVPTKPLSVEELQGPRAYHDVAFDKAGNLIGNNNGDLLKTSLGGKPKILLAGIGTVEGMDSLPNGDLLVVATTDDEFTTSLLRVTPEGGQEQIASFDFGAYGVRIGPEGSAYVAAGDALYRVDLATKNKKVVPTQFEVWSPRVMDYSPDKKKLYVGTLAFEGEGGTVYVFDLDENYLPVGNPKLFATKVGGGYHDGLSVDACGNVFVADFTETALYRITPDGKVSLYQDWKETFVEENSPSDYGHGIEFGSGVGGWDKRSIFLPQPYDDNTVVRLDIGVPARPR